MTELPNDIFRRWGHSFEEDVGDITVYRPAEYEFPRARGRASIEFQRDGKFIDWAIGPADAPRGVSGHWWVEDPGRVRISSEGDVQAPRVLEILQCDAGVLRVRQRPASP